jgi:hypothetical protein
MPPRHRRARPHRRYGYWHLVRRMRHEFSAYHTRNPVRLSTAAWRLLSPRQMRRTERRSCRNEHRLSLDDGRNVFNSNKVERSLGGLALNRKNAIFVGTTERPWRCLSGSSAQR